VKVEVERIGYLDHLGYTALLHNVKVSIGGVQALEVCKKKKGWKPEV